MQDYNYGLLKMLYIKDAQPEICTYLILGCVPAMAAADKLLMNTKILKIKHSHFLSYIIYHLSYFASH